jgi:hypothetical protein
MDDERYGQMKRRCVNLVTAAMVGVAFSAQQLIVLMTNKAKQALLVILVCLFQSVACANTPEGYPPVGYRDHRYTGIHCLAADAAKSIAELFILKTTTAKIAAGKQFEAEVAEFFSGRRYRTVLKPETDYRVIAKGDGNRRTLDCIPRWGISALDKEHPIDATGDYLAIERIGTTGQYGDFPLKNKCDTGKNGWTDCDVGTFGFSRRSKNGTIKWARLLAIGVPFKGGHPLYEFPFALNIIDEFNYGTLLNDGTAILTYLDHMSIRIDMKTGFPINPRPDVASVPLEDWAQLKHILYERWERNTQTACGPRDTRCWKDLIEVYFYGLQNYLFPSYSIGITKQEQSCRNSALTPRSHRSL